MSGAALPAGAFLTTIDGRRCTAVPRTAAAASNAPAVASVDAAPPVPPAAAATTQAAAPVQAVDNGPEANPAPADAQFTGAASTTSSSFSTSTSTTTSSLVLNIAALATQLGNDDGPAPPALAATAPAAAPPANSPTLPTFTVITTSSQTQATSGLEISETDVSITASAVDVGANSRPAATPEVSLSPALTDTPEATSLLTPLPTVPSNGGAAAESNAPTTNSAVSAVPNSSSNTVQSTVAVAGGVIGGVVAISIAAFLIWWWRRRVIKKRRSTLLTPLDAANYRDEKGAYVINRGSIGPTPMGEKFRNALGYNVKKFRGRMSSLTKKSGSHSVNLDRGTSQFMDPANSHSRAGSSVTGGRDEVTSKDRFLDWWSRLTADMNFNWRMRKGIDKDAISIASSDSRNEKRGVNAAQPDFLTLLNMDDGELDREAQRRRASLSRKNGSAGSADHFLGRLNLDFGSRQDDPFSDANALAHTSAQPAPLAVSSANNPFSDSNAIRDPPPTMPKPSTYISDMRRSRGQSVSTTNRQPSTIYNGGRDSGGSVGEFAGRRNKFRSDPFDLERPELLAGARAAKNSITSSTAGTMGSDGRGSRVSGGVGTGDIRRPPGAHQRSESFTSKYSSGISMGDWSDPGPDVGPAATRWDGPEPRASPTQGWRDRLEKERAEKAGVKRNNSVGSQRSVGKAM
ncbi:hypothetical protein OQA88_8841 [Cercophora sp. LCS_1]